MDELPEVLVTPTTVIDPLDLQQLFRAYNDAVQLASSGGGYIEAFAPPVPSTLPEVIVRKPKVTPTPPPPPKAAPRPSPLIGAIARTLAPVVGLFYPTPMGPRELDEAPTIPKLPEVLVTQPRLPPRTPPKPPPVSMDPIRPPNWKDLARPDFLTPYEQPIPKSPFTNLVGDMLRFGSKYLDDAFEIFNDRPDTEHPPAIARPPARNPSPVGVPDLIEFPRPDVWEIAPRAPVPDASPYVAPPTPFPDFWPEIGPRPVDPRPELRPEVRPSPKPGDLANPLLSPGFQPFPFGAPFPVPAPRAPPASRPTPKPTPRPDAFFEPFGDPYGAPLDPLSDPGGRLDADRCNCPKPTKPKQKKPKKREPRTQCRQGTYTQRAKGIIYTPRRTIPCR
jgi:hypothetical protein